MTPRQAGIVLVGFIALMAGVAYNALYLQGSANRRIEKAVAIDRGKRAEAPKSDTRSAEPTKRASMLKADKADTANAEAFPEPLAEETDAETVRAIQRELTQRGYGQLPLDGIVRPATRAAIMAFEHDTKLPLTAHATPVQLKQILLGVSVASDGTGAGEVRSPHAEALVRHVQRLLAARGAKIGTPDGRLGAQTVAAIRAFEAEQGLTPQGRISADVLARLDRPRDTKAAAR